MILRSRYLYRADAAVMAPNCAEIMPENTIKIELGLFSCRDDIYITIYMILMAFGRNAK